MGTLAIDAQRIGAMAGWPAPDVARWQGSLTGWRVSGIAAGEQCQYFRGLQPEVSSLPGFTHQNGHIAQRCLVVGLIGDTSGAKADVEVDLVFTLRGWSLSGGLAGPIPSR